MAEESKYVFLGVDVVPAILDTLDEMTERERGIFTAHLLGTLLAPRIGGALYTKDVADAVDAAIKYARTHGGYGG